MLVSTDPKFLGSNLFLLVHLAPTKAIGHPSHPLKYGNPPIYLLARIYVLKRNTTTNDLLRCAKYSYMSISFPFPQISDNFNSRASQFPDHQIAKKPISKMSQFMHRTSMTKEKQLDVG